MSMEKDQIFIWGSNEHNQCYYSEEKLVSVINFDKRQSFIKKIISVSSGASHCLILTDDGEVYSWGNNSKGQVGNGEFCFKQPQKLYFYHKCDKFSDNADVKIQKISAGRMFSVFLTNCGCLIRKGSIFGDPSQSMEMSMSSLPGNVTQVCCGVSHVMLLLSTGHVACFGRNMYGQIGVQRQDLERNIETVLTPRIVTGNFLHRITKIASGSYHSLCCDEMNQIFCWGYGVPCGVLNGHVMQPSFLSGLCEPIRTLAAGSSHSLFLTESETLYCIGGNEFAQAMPNCDTKYFVSLSRISYFTDGIEDVYCGENYSVVKENSGNISMWGKNSLLIDPAYPISFRFSVPQTVISKEMLGDTDVVSMSCGSWHIICHCSSSYRNTNDATEQEEIGSNGTSDDSVYSKSKNKHLHGSMMPSDVKRKSSDNDKDSSSMQRERTYTSLRDLYSKTPNHRRHAATRDHSYHSLVPLRNNESLCASTPLTNTTDDDSTKEINHQYSVYGAHLHHKSPQSIKEDKYLSIMKYSDTESKYELRSATSNVKEMHESTTDDHTRMPTINHGSTCTERKQSHLLKILDYERFRKPSQEVTRRIFFHKSKTEYISPPKNCFVSKRSVEQIHQSLKFPHKVDLKLSKEYTSMPHRSFIFAGKMKTSLGKNCTVFPDVKWWKSN